MRKLLAAIVLAPAVSFGWGFDGHRRLSSLLQDPLPANHCLKGWYASRQTATLQNKACDPDRWRINTDPNFDPNEAPRHFLEIDRISPITAYPRDWTQVQLTFTNFAYNNGRVPWHVDEMYTRLVDAFRAKDLPRILDTTFWMSHYVTDSFSVLHDTKNFNPGGNLHTRWESDMLQVSSQINAITTLAKSYYGTVGHADPKNNTFDVVLVGNSLVQQLSDWNYAFPGDEVGFYNAVKDFTARRWGDALTLLASLVWSAWAEAGAPMLTGFTNGCSMALPPSEIVLKGYPPPGGFTHPDGGNPDAPDASVTIDDGGVTDAGCIDGCTDDAGSGTGGGAGGGAAGGEAGGQTSVGGGGEMPLRGCGCGSVPQALGLMMALALLWRKRR